MHFQNMQNQRISKLQSTAIYLFLLMFSFGFQALSAVSTSDLSLEVRKSLPKVHEFLFIQEQAQKMGVKVYLFGGTAAAFAHYVRWDLERQEGDIKHQPERFDYDFTNIYRGNQDLDLVVDGTAQQALELQRILRNEYPHFVGNKDSWEVRLLRESLGDKHPLLDDYNFKNQHTDTNSTGLIDLTVQNEEYIFRDLLDWENEESLFLQDVAAARITYLFNNNHESTQRAMEGKNPPIFSAMRYLAKLAQYEVTPRDEDLETIKKIVEETNFLALSDYVMYKLGEFALKTLLNSPNSEYAWNLLDDLGIRKKLIKMDHDKINQTESLSWWMNKEPLRSHELGQHGRTAGGIFESKNIIVSHETNSFLAYENITRSSRGEANAFISRAGVMGESAMYGDGFYTRVGQAGARGTGLTIRFNLHPDAREGEDFIVQGDYVIVKNKKALTLIQENINIDVIDFLKLTHSGEISVADRGLSQKFLRKFKRLPKDSKEFNNAVKFVKSQFLISPRLPDELKYKDFIKLEDINFEQLFEIYQTGIEEYYNAIIIPSLSSHAWFWRQNVNLIDQMIDNDIVTKEIIVDLFGAHHEHFTPDKIEPLIKKILLKSREYDQAIVEFVFHTNKDWHKYPDLLKLIWQPLDQDLNERNGKYIYLSHAKGTSGKIVYRGLVSSTSNIPSPSKMKQVESDRSIGMTELIIQKLFRFPEWHTHTDIIEAIMKYPYFDTSFIDAIAHKEYNEILYNIIEKVLSRDEIPLNVMGKIVGQILIDGSWDEYVKSFLNKIVERNLHDVNKLILTELIFNPDYDLRQYAKETLIQIILNLHPTHNLLTLITDNLRFSNPFHEDDLYEILLLLHEKEATMRLKYPVFLNFSDDTRNVHLINIFLDKSYHLIVAQHILPQPQWIKHPKFADKIIDAKYGIKELITRTLAQPYWAKHPYLVEKILNMNPKPNSEIIESLIENVLFNKKWAEHTYLFEKILRNFPQHTQHLVKYATRNKSTSFFNHEETISLVIENLFKQSSTNAIGYIIRHIFTNHEWKAYLGLLKTFFNKIKKTHFDSNMTQKSVRNAIEILLSHDFELDNPEFMKFFIDQIPEREPGLRARLSSHLFEDKLSRLILDTYFLNQDWSAYPELLVELISKKTINRVIDHDILRYLNPKENVLSQFIDGQTLTTDNILKKLKTTDFKSWLTEHKKMDKSILSCTSLLK